MQQHPEQDDIPAYALGALEAEEARRIGKHLAVCRSCHDEVAAYQAVVGMLCYAIPAQEPPAELRERIVTHIAVVTESCAVTSG